MLVDTTVWLVGLGMGVLPVDIDIQSSAEVVCDGINHDVKDHGGQHPISTDERQIGLSLTADTDFALPIIAADVFAESRVLDKNAQCE